MIVFLLEPVFDIDEKLRPGNQFYRLPKHVKVHVIEFEEQLDEVWDAFVADISAQKIPAVGLDTEWTSGYKQSTTPVGM